MNILLTILAIIAVAVLVGLVVIYSGWPNVAVTSGHSPLAMWALNETMESSVRAHAKGITVPALTDSAMIREGFEEYDEMCVMCHGAPGAARNYIGRGLHPEPPNLVATVPEWKPEELFWITKNGVKMTGMPAFGVTHSDEELWTIIAFLRKLPDLTPEQYLAMRAAAGAGEEENPTEMRHEEMHHEH